MVVLNARLNPRQVEVLRWIADGCPQGVMQDFTHKTTAVALKNRRLVTLSKKGGAWAASITDVGRQYLEHGRYPEAVKPSPLPAVRTAEPRSEKKTKAEPRRHHESAEASTAPPTAPAPAAVLKRSSTSATKHLVHVPLRLGQTHAAVAVLRDNPERLGVSKAVRSRALRIIQGLIVAAEKYGATVKAVGVTRDGYGRATWDAKEHFMILTAECRIGVRVVQEDNRSPHEPTKHELAEHARYWWNRIPTYDYAPSDRLRIELSSAHDGGRRHKWADRTRWSLEDKLPQILDEIAARDEEAKQRRIVEERREEERSQRWEAAVETAKARLRETHRGEMLRQQAERWQQACCLRQYLLAMELVIDEVDEREAHSAREWLEWGLGHADQLDPLKRRIEMPPDPDPTAEALRPFLSR